jgi:hypothetical protein
VLFDEHRHAGIIARSLGAGEARREGAGMKRVEELGAMVLRDADNSEVRLEDLWRDRPAVLVWIRHYG